MSKNKRKLNELFVLKGMTIFFVVVVHICYDFYNPTVMATIHSVKDFMYLFMFASGFLFGISKTRVASFSEYFDFAAKKTRRLLIPYLMITAIILFLKSTAGMFVSLKMPVSADFWKYILLYPRNGFSAFLWYIYVLYIIFLIFPLMKWAVRNHYLLFFLLLAIYFIPVPRDFFFELDLVRFYLLFFYMGYFYSSLKYETINKYSGYLCVAFFISLLILLRNEQIIYRSLKSVMSDSSIYQLYYLMLGTFLTFSFYYVSILITVKGGVVFNLLKYIGTYSPAIYLFHTIFMSALCIALRQYKQSTGATFISILLVFAGILFPILMTKYFISRSEKLSLLLLGSYTAQKD